MQNMTGMNEKPGAETPLPLADTGTLADKPEWGRIWTVTRTLLALWAVGIWSLLMWHRPAFTTPVAGVFGGVVTVAIGSILRVFTHQGVQWSFIAVALTFNALLLVATRFLVRFWERSA